MNIKISFYDWCINHNRQDLIDRFDNELNKIDTKNISYGSNKKYYFKCPRGLHESELFAIASITNMNIRMKCKKCNSFAQKCIDIYGTKFIDEHWHTNNILDPWRIPYSYHKDKVCLAFNESTYWITPHDFTRNDKNRSKLVNRKIEKQNLFDCFPEINNFWSIKNDKLPVDFTPNSHVKVWWKCPDGNHEDFLREIIYSKRRNFRCPDCSREEDESTLQKKVVDFLSTYNFTINHEYKCTLVPINPKTKMYLPFDNEIEELKLIIEVHGLQHYSTKPYIDRYNNGQQSPENQLHYQKLKDRYKKFIASINNYYYLEIPWWSEIDESFTRLIEKSIRNIIRKQS